VEHSKFRRQLFGTSFIVFSPCVILSSQSTHSVKAPSRRDSVKKKKKTHFFKIIKIKKKMGTCPPKRPPEPPSKKCSKLYPTQKTRWRQAKINIARESTGKTGRESLNGTGPRRGKQGKFVKHFLRFVITTKKKKRFFGKRGKNNEGRALGGREDFKTKF